MPKTKNQRQNTAPINVVTVNFALNCPSANHVCVCGDFNDWQPVGLALDDSPDSRLWQRQLPLRPGRYEYKFLVDGEWQHDPTAPQNTVNAFGSLNSVVEVHQPILSTQ